jgi:hypothetical protein
MNIDMARNHADTVERVLQQSQGKVYGQVIGQARIQVREKVHGQIWGQVGVNIHRQVRENLST